MIVSDLRSENILAHRLEHMASANSLQLIRLAKNEVFLGENTFVELSSQPVRFRHPDSLMAVRGNWLIGCKLDVYPVILALELQKEDTIVAEKKVVITKDQPENSSFLRHLGVTLRMISMIGTSVRTEFPESLDVPEEWSLSLIKGQECVIGAFWHPLD